MFPRRLTTFRLKYSFYLPIVISGDVFSVRFLWNTDYCPIKALDDDG